MARGEVTTMIRDYLTKIRRRIFGLGGNEYRVKTAFTTTDGTHVPAGSIIEGEERGEELAPINREYVLKRFEEVGEFPVIRDKYEGHRFAVIPGEAVGEQDTLIYADSLERPDGES